LAKTVLAMPDFARGPDDAQPVKVPNNTASGIPITLYNAAGVTDVTFTLTFDWRLLAVAGALGGAGGDATDPASSFTPGTGIAVAGLAYLVFHANAPLSGTVVLGDIQATVPSDAKDSYKLKQLLQLSSIKVNGANFSGVTAPGVHVNAYFGDVSGDGVIGAADVN